MTSTPPKTPSESGNVPDPNPGQAGSAPNQSQPPAGSSAAPFAASSNIPPVATLVSPPPGGSQNSTAAAAESPPTATLSTTNSPSPPVAVVVQPPPTIATPTTAPPSASTPTAAVGPNGTTAQTAATIAPPAQLSPAHAAPASSPPNMHPAAGHSTATPATPQTPPDTPTAPAPNDRNQTQPRRGWMRWPFAAFRLLFRTMSLVAVLAMLTAVPLLQIIAFGYLLDVAGRLTRREKWSEVFPWGRQIGRLGLAGVTLYLAAQPTRLLSHWSAVADLVSPGSRTSAWLSVASIIATIAMMIYLAWAWIRGGRVRHYLLPEPIRFVKEFWRPSTWSRASDELWHFAVSFELPRLFWLGLRGVLGTLVWLSPAVIIIAATRNGDTGVANVVAVLGFIGLGISLMYLPMLQAQFAADNKLRSMFAFRKIRRLYRRAPLAWTTAMLLTLGLLPILLYLLKIEAPPEELVWLLCLFFIAFALPARIACGLALGRANNRPDPTSIWAMFCRWLGRFGVPVIVGFYLLVVWGSQYTSWDGVDTWIQQHAVLVPVPM